jgi:hypothetical protein
MRYLTKGIGLAFCCLLLLSVARAGYAAEIDGKWDFKLDYASGTYIVPFDLTLKAEGEKVTGTHGKETFEGTFKDGKLEISGNWYVPEAGYASTLKITGTLSGGTIKGSATWDTYSLGAVGTKAK